MTNTKKSKCNYTAKAMVENNITKNTQRDEKNENINIKIACTVDDVSVEIQKYCILYTHRYIMCKKNHLSSYRFLEVSLE